jgi:hypothetical protein
LRVCVLASWNIFLRTVLVLTALAAALATTSLAIVGLFRDPVRATAVMPDSPRHAPAAGSEIATIGEMIAQDSWLDWLGRSGFWGESRDERNRGWIFEPREAPPARPIERREAFRTLCVRLCDGFYWPVGYATQRDRLARDAKQCERSCPSRARLFLHRNPGGEVDDMVDLDGHPYRKLSTAFLYRTQYVADCTCRGHPWEEEALARHRSYAVVAKSKASPKAP